MNQLGSFEDVIEKGQSGVKQAAKSAQAGVGNIAKTATGQVSASQQPTDHGVNEANAQNPTQQQMSDDDAQKFLQDLYGVKKPVQDPNQQNQSQQAPQGHALQNQKPKYNQQTVKAALGLELTKKPQEKVPTTKETIKAALGIPGEKPHGDAPSVRETVTTAMGLPDALNGVKTPEEEAKMEALRGELHGEYYRKLTKPQQQEEESVVEKLEREDQEKKFDDLETQKEKPPPLPSTVKQGTGENVVGVSG